MTSVITVIDVDRINAINREHELCESTYGTALAHALNCGRMLAEVKAELGHGNWLPWLAENFNGSERTARAYMQVAGAPEISNRQSSADLTGASIAAALRELTRPAPAPKLRDAAAAVALMEDDDDQMAQLPAAIDAAADRLRADAAARAWTPQHERRRQQIDRLVDDVRGKMAIAASGNLAPLEIGELLRDAEVKCRQATAQIGNLAFDFE